MGEKDKNDLESKNTQSKQALADRFFKRFVENEDQINFTKEDVIKEIRNLEKNLKKYDVLEIVLDCCTEEIISDHIANTLTTYEDFLDCFIFADNLRSRLGRYLKGDLLNIYKSAEHYWRLIVREDSLTKQIRKYGGYRNYLKNVKPKEKCASCGKELREHEGYYSRGDNVYCFLCKKELIWCKSCTTYVRISDFEFGNDIMCKYCDNHDYTGVFDDSITSQDTHWDELNPDFASLNILRECEIIKNYENDIFAEKPYKDDDELAELHEELNLGEDFSKPVEMVLEEEKIELLKFLSNENRYSYLLDEPQEEKIENRVLTSTPISQIQPGKSYLIKGLICGFKSLFIHTICIRCLKNMDDCTCQDNGTKKEVLIIHLEINDDTGTIDCLFLDSVAERLVHTKIELIKQIINNPDFKHFLDRQYSELIGKVIYVRGKVEFWKNLNRRIILIKGFRDVDIEVLRSRVLDLGDHDMK